MKIQNKEIGDRVLIIAEIGNNHEGSYSLAEEMIGKAKEAGVDAVKFQTFKTKYFINKSDKDRYRQLKKFELTYEEFERLKNVAYNEDLIFISTPFDLESAKFLKSIVDVIKIASGDNTFYPLINEVAKTNLPIILSSGLVDLNQIIKTKKLINDVWKKSGRNNELAILHCVSSYPVKPKYANLNAIRTLIKNFSCEIGYSDHTLGIDASYLAVILGARIIEKHFTLDNHFSDFRDHQLSANPADMKTLVRMIRDLEQIKGSGEKVPQTCEIDSLKSMRRSIIAKTFLPKGKMLKLEDISWVRPGGGVKPGEESLLIGKRVTRNIFSGKKILLRDVK